MNDLQSLADDIKIVGLQAQYAEQLEQLQIIGFPDLAEHQRMKKEHYLHCITLFVEGQFIALDGERVIGSTTTMLASSEQINQPHSFDAMFCEGWLSAHNPKGDWLYGLDVVVLSQYRGRGIARALYRARQQVVHALKLKGQRTVGMLNGYGKWQDQMSAEQYLSKVKSGALKDPTVSAQMKVGFMLGQLIPEYLDDPTCGNYGVELILPAEKKI